MFKIDCFINSKSVNTSQLNAKRNQFQLLLIFCHIQFHNNVYTRTWQEIITSHNRKLCYIDIQISDFIKRSEKSEFTHHECVITKISFNFLYQFVCSSEFLNNVSLFHCRAQNNTRHVSSQFPRNSHYCKFKIFSRADLELMQRTFSWTDSTSVNNIKKLLPILNITVSCDVSEDVPTCR
jgi:hypothetical protein